MKRFVKTIEVEANVEKVWNMIFEPQNFSLWTEVFTKGSYYEGSLEEGSPVRFLAKNSKGQIDGMVGEIAENKYPEVLSIRHLGWVFDGVDDTTSEGVKSWAPAYENYRLEKKGDERTSLTVEADLSDTYYEQFSELWPKAMLRIKELCEAE